VLESSARRVRNLLCRRSFAATWPDLAIVQQLVAQLPWGHNLQLLGKLDDPELATSWDNADLCRF